MASKRKVIVNTKDPLTKLLEAYLLVHRCWERPHLSDTEDMGFGRAIDILRVVRDGSMTKHGGGRLARKAHKLIQDIVKNSVAPPSLKDLDKEGEEGRSA